MARFKFYLMQNGLYELWLRASSKKFRSARELKQKLNDLLAQNRSLYHSHTIYSMPPVTVLSVPVHLVSEVLLKGGDRV